ncbi:MAG: DMT family transporter [Emergencia sp.]|nr:DMT family transporter [Emergencia sp.]
MKEKITEKKWFVYALVPLCALMWGLSYLGTSVTLKHLEIMELLALRWTVSALLFLVLIALRVVKVKFKGKNVKLVVLVGILQPCIYATFETLGVKYTSTSESSIFIATIPLMVLLISALVLHQKTSKRTIGAIFLAFLGVLVCVYFSPNFSLGGKGIGYVFLIGAVISGALYTLCSSKAAAEFDAIEVTFTLSIIGAICFNAISFAMGNGVRGYVLCFTDTTVLAGVLFLGVCCSCLCYLIYNFVLGKLPTTIGANLVANSVTAVGVLSGCLFAGDPFGWYTVAGVALTITGVCLASTGSQE